LETTIHGVNFLANSFKGSSTLVTDLGKSGLNIGEYGKFTLNAAGKTLTAAGVLIPLIDMSTNPNADYWSDGTDAVMAAVGFVPGVGWIISGIYFFANTATESLTGESIGDHLRDGLSNPNVQNSMVDISQMPDF
jgi:hypothetical protein